MAFVKVIPPGSQKFDDVPSQLIKISRKGLIGSDFRDFVKRAGHNLAYQVQEMEFKEGEVPVHLIALGATESSGWNRNGDGFRSETCRRYHDTFKKHAKWFRNHSNKVPSESYGIVKESAFNEDMQRIELIVALNGNEKIAKENDGHVADQELEKLAKGKDIPVSMACFVPLDICSVCGNKAKNRTEYCTGVHEGGHCKGGGLRNNMGAVLEDGTQLYADNPDPKFFDISHVIRPADRIAYVTGQIKAASGREPSGAELADELGLTVPSLWLSPEDRQAADIWKTLTKLAETEEVVQANPTANENFGINSHQTSVIPPRGTLHEKLAALLSNDILLSPGEFLKVVGHDKPDVATQMQHVLPGIYGRLKQAGELNELSSIVSSFSVNHAQPSMAIKAWSEKLAEDFSLTPEIVRRRSMRNRLRDSEIRLKSGYVKMASAVEQLARLYALYKLAFVMQAEPETKLNPTNLYQLAVRQNYR